MRARLAGLVCILVAASGCTIKQGPGCEGGFCGVHHVKFTETAVRPRKDPSEVQMLRGEIRVPAGTEIVGYFEWAINVFDLSKTGECSDEIEGFFRGKAANMGFDGVVGVQQLIQKKVTSVTLTHADGTETTYPLDTHGPGYAGSSGLCVGFPFVYKVDEGAR